MPHQSFWCSHVEPLSLAEASCILIQVLGSHLSACYVSNYIQVNTIVHVAQGPSKNKRACHSFPFTGDKAGLYTQFIKKPDL